MVPVKHRDDLVADIVHRFAAQFWDLLQRFDVLRMSFCWCRAPSVDLDIWFTMGCIFTSGLSSSSSVFILILYPDRSVKRYSQIFPMLILLIESILLQCCHICLDVVGVPARTPDSCEEPQWKSLSLKLFSLMTSPLNGKIYFWYCICQLRMISNVVPIGGIHVHQLPSFMLWMQRTVRDSLRR